MNIDLLHHDLMRGGGGEAVAVHAIEAIQQHHEVTVHTFTSPDIAWLNDHFNAAVDGDRLEIVQYRTTGRILETLKDRTGFGFDVLSGALLAQRYRRYRPQGELAVSTINELPLDVPSVQYVHLPQFNRSVLPATHSHDSVAYDLYDSLSRRLCDYDVSTVQTASRLLANSRWTASLASRVYSGDPSVVYPPVDTETFRECRRVDWEDRDPSFVSIGRLAPIKRVERVIRIVDALRAEHSRSAGLYIVGPPANEQYAERIRTLAGDREFINLEGELGHDSDRLQSLIAENRYYLNGTEHESFGISIAEAIAGGMVPFVPDNGGQREVVGRIDELLYTGISDAVERIEAVMRSESTQRELRSRLPDPESVFGLERFRRQVDEHVTRAADELVEHP